MDITLSGIKKEFRAVTALRDIALHVRSGELMALLGPSGSGKTTLLRIIAGLDVPDAGRILFGEEDATDLPVQKRRVGFVFQHYALFKHLTIQDNIAYGLRSRERARRPSETEIKKRVFALLELVQLEGFERRYPAQLSGGQRQRVALARALAVEPRVLLLDEPFGALDAKVRKDLRRWLRDLHEQTGQTTIFVTHDQDEALELADRVAVLNHGRLEQVGTPAEIYDRPASPFVMAFVGDTTRLPVSLLAGRVTVGGRNSGLILPEQPDGALDLYVRPWDFIVTESSFPGLSGTVASIHRSGQILRCAVILEAAPVTVEVDVGVGSDLKRGDTVNLTLRSGKMFSRGA